MERKYVAIEKEMIETFKDGKTNKPQRKTMKIDRALSVATKREMKAHFCPSGKQCDQIGRFFALWATF